MAPAAQSPPRRGRGFARAGSLVAGRIKAAGAARGFTATKLLTHWADIVGPDIARLCQPARITYGRGGLGGTLVLLARGAAGPILQAHLPTIREKVNACYGHAAIARIELTQTDGAAHGFAEGQTPFTGAPRRGPDPAGRGGTGVTAPSVDAASTGRAATLAGTVSDPDLRAALQSLGATVIARSRKGHRP